MKKFLFLCLLIQPLPIFALDSQTENKVEQANIARLESLRSECLLKYSGNQRKCRKNVLKQCRETMKKDDCLVLMSKMPKSKMPKTNGPGVI